MINGSKNKGDWSEFYVLVYLLAKKRITAADERLNEIPEYYFPIIKIMRDEERKSIKSTNHIEFVISNHNGIDSIEIHVDSELMKSVPSQDFYDELPKLLTGIINGNGRQFNIAHGEEFLNKLELERLSEPASKVADIQIQVHDTNTSRKQNMGFSIKSYLGGAPTLLNASEATNFVYEISGLTNEQMTAINNINTKQKIVDRISEILKCGGNFNYSRTQNAVFSGNMMLIDTCMEQIIADMLLFHYTNNVAGCIDVLEDIESRNPLNYPRQGMYIYKFKKFLCAKALGMDPSKIWGGMEEANGGYIAVKSDGNVLAYFLYDRARFEKYLLDNTYFERGSTTRHHFAYIYKDGDKMYMNLNLQIRFLNNH